MSEIDRRRKKKMADTVLRKSSEPFLSQVQAHRECAEHTRQMLSQYQIQHENVLAALQGTSLAKGLPHYISWWEAFQTSLSHHADLHEKMAEHLEKSNQNFDQLDADISKEFVGGS
jgi:hypothetical protein